MLDTTIIAATVITECSADTRNGFRASFTATSRAAAAAVIIAVKQRQ